MLSYLGYSDQGSLETGREAFAHFVQPWLAAAAWKALRTTSTMRWEVNTFPPQTAAVRDGAKRDFLGILTERKSKFYCRRGRVRLYSNKLTVKRDKTSCIEWNV